MTRPILLTALGLALAPVTSTAQSVDEPPKEFNAKVIALGHQRAATFVRSKKDRVMEVPNVDGSKMEKVVIKAGTPIEVRGEKFEYLPAQVFYQNRTQGELEDMKPLRLVANQISPTLTIKPRTTLNLSLRTPAANPDDKATFSPYVAATLPSADSLVTLVANIKDKEFWRKPSVFTFDTSPQALPPASLFFFNATPFPIELDVPLRDSKEPLIVEAYKTATVQPGVNSKGRTRAIVKLISRKAGIKKQFYYNTVLVPQNGRVYLMAHFDPTPNAPNPACIVQFSDKIAPASPVSN
ncbi:hypothetical protein NT6N_20980 [Oceaniferula spumae]|uniref:DUF4138 domain-containing protein n=1 Tax=Oceaniferula spumae TaxID=2979115 RepID=A0AAT9FM67_9BACT